MELDNYRTLLPLLGPAIDQSLASWDTYLHNLSLQPTYTAIVSTEKTSVTATKIQALQYLLSALPLRHYALVRACMDFELETVELPKKCINLLGKLDSLGEQMDLDGYFGYILGKRFVAKVTDIEEKLAAEELVRKQGLGRLKAVWMGLMSVREDGELGLKEVEKLVNAMEAFGVSLAGTGLVGDETG